MKPALFFLLFLTGLSVVSAIGVSPPSYKVDFEPGLTKEFSFTIVNNVDSDIYAKVYAAGDLAAYVTFTEEQVFLAKGGTAGIKVLLSLPDEIEPPGIHKIQIRILEQYVMAQGGASARAGVIPVIILDVPYPGQYAIITDFTVANGVGGVNEGEDTPVAFTIVNKGKEDLYATTAEIILEDLNGQRVDRVVFSDIHLPVGETYTKSLTLSTNTLSPSDYEATLKYSYGITTREETRGFRVGNFDVALVNHTKELVKGGILPFSFSVRNLWKGTVYVKGTLFVPGTEPATSATITISDFKTGDLQAFIDTTPLGYGDLQGVLTLTAEKAVKGETENIITKEVPLTLTLTAAKRPARETPALLASPLAFILIMLLLLLLVNGFFLIKTFRKKHK